MKTITKLMILGIALNASVAIAFTGAFTGNDVMEWNGPMRLSYVMGMIDSMPVEVFPACMPEAISYNQFDEIFIKYLNDFPQVRHLHAPKLFIDSLDNAFPCQNKKDTKKSIEQKF